MRTAGKLPQSHHVRPHAHLNENVGESNDVWTCVSETKTFWNTVSAFQVCPTQPLFPPGKRQTTLRNINVLHTHSKAIGFTLTQINCVSPSSSRWEAANGTFHSSSSTRGPLNSQTSTSISGVLWYSPGDREHMLKLFRSPGQTSGDVVAQDCKCTYPAESYFLHQDPAQLEQVAFSSQVCHPETKVLKETQ